jgi:hypothetical protein
MLYDYFMKTSTDCVIPIIHIQKIPDPRLAFKTAFVRARGSFYKNATRSI